MRKFSRLFYGIVVSSVILTISSKRNSNRTLADTEQKGYLALVANGEDFVRQGFVSKDGWKIDFDRVFVNIGNAVAYSTSDSFEPQKGDTTDSIDYQNKVDFLDGAVTTDLAKGEEDAEPIVISEVDVPVGFYNALAWKLSTADSDSAIEGKTIVLQGKATKDEETIDFNLGFDRPTEYICGKFIGDDRQGIVAANALAEVEATFHFDRIFGDGDAPSEDALNQGALGFEPLAQLASNGTLSVEERELSEQLSDEDYQKLSSAIAGLGHVGEGHCEVIRE